MFKNFKHESQIQLAIKYCKAWNVERVWLMKNRVNFKEFPEEVKFKELTTKYKLIKRANMAKLSRAVQGIAEKNASQKYFQLKVDKQQKNINQLVSKKIKNMFSKKESEELVPVKKGAPSKSRQNKSKRDGKTEPLDTIKEETKEHLDESQLPDFEKVVDEEL
jgi:uncharacterized membrane protein YfhO